MACGPYGLKLFFSLYFQPHGQTNLVLLQHDFFFAVMFSEVICDSTQHPPCLSIDLRCSLALTFAFRADNPPVLRHVLCLSVRRIPLIWLAEGFCDKHTTSHQRRGPYTTTSKTNGTQAGFHICPSHLDTNRAGQLACACLCSMSVVGR